MAVPTTFGTLRTEIQNWAVRSNTAFTDLDENFVRYAQDEMNSDPRFRFKQMEAAVDLVLKKSVTADSVGGTANAITLTRPTADTVTSYTLGQRDKFTAESTNTSTVTVNIDGVGATAVRKGDGSTLGALEANDIVNGHTYELYYDGTVFRLLPAESAVPLPSRYVGTRRLFLDRSPRTEIELVAPEYFHSRVGANRARYPDMATIEGQYIVFAPKADQAYAGKHLYWRGLAAFTADGDTDWLLTDKPSIYVYKCLSVAFRQLRQPAAAAMYEALYEEERDNYRTAQNMDRYGSTPRMKSNVNVY